MWAQGHFGELSADQNKVHAETHHLTHQKAERKRMGNSHKMERNRSRRSQGHSKERIHEHRILRTAVSFGGGTKDIGTHVEQQRQGVPRKFLGNVGRKRAHENHGRAKDCNRRRNPKRFHNPVVAGAVVQAILRKIPIQTFIESKRCRMGYSQKERLRRNEDTKFSGAKNTRHHKSQQRAANFEDCPHDVYDHRLFQKLTVCFQIGHNKPKIDLFNITRPPNPFHFPMNYLY